ncbi:MAG: hypothetical protein QOI54_3554 [Actinomycetota bacterium]|nr:hypothetical protein [Actinomycetota bacterium]
MRRVAPLPGSRDAREPVASWRAILAQVLVVAALFFLYLGTATFDQRQNIDTLSTLVPAWQLASHGNVFADQYGGFTPWFVEVRDHVVSNRLPGAILWATPFYLLLGRGGALAPLYPAAVASAAAAALAAWFLYRVLLRICVRRVAVCAALLFALATPTWSISADALWTHGPAQLFLALSLLLYAKQRYAAGGLSQGFAILIRPHLAVVPLVQGIWTGVAQRSLRPALVVGLTSALGIAGLLLYYRLVYRVWTVAGGYGRLGGYAEGDQSDLEPRLRNFAHLGTNVLGALVSPGRGMLVYTPFLLLLLPGLHAAWRTAPVWARSAAVAGVVYALVQLGNNSFAGGEDFFGYRLMLEPLTLWAPLLALSYQSWTDARRWRRALFAVAAAGTAVWQATAAVSHSDFQHPLHPWSHTGYADVGGQQPVLLLAFSVVGLLVLAAAPVRSRLARGGATVQPGGSRPSTQSRERS